MERENSSVLAFKQGWDHLGYSVLSDKFIHQIYGVHARIPVILSVVAEYTACPRRFYDF
jgi:hypothetical protein